MIRLQPQLFQAQDVEPLEIHIEFSVLPSSSVSKQHLEIPGPMAARISPDLEPYTSTILSTALPAMPLAVPRQPAWTAAMTRRTGS